MIIILHHQIKTLITGLFFGVDGIKSKSFMAKDFTNLTNFFFDRLWEIIVLYYIWIWWSWTTVFIRWLWNWLEHPAFLHIVASWSCHFIGHSLYFQYNFLVSYRHSLLENWNFIINSWIDNAHSPFFTNTGSKKVEVYSGIHWTFWPLS